MSNEEYCPSCGKERWEYERYGHDLECTRYGVNPEKLQMSSEQWYAEGTRLFGENKMQWKFKCPACSHVASVQDYKDAGAPQTAVGFSCIGRWLEDCSEAFDPGSPCNYAGGGLIQINPVVVDMGEDDWMCVFEFAEPETCDRNNG